jgi:hypothetical protein
MGRRIARERRKRDRLGPTHIADFLYDGAYSGAIGGSVVALYFLGLDAIRAEVFYTPSLLGQVLFLRIPPEAVTAVRLDLVALFTVCHIAAFGAVGFAISAMIQRLEELALHPGVVTVIIFLILEAGILIPESIVMPGAVAAIGPGWLALANVLTASAMAFFLLGAHRKPDIEYVRMPETEESEVGESISTPGT